MPARAIDLGLDAPIDLRLLRDHRIDGRLMAILAASLLVHGGIALSAWLGDVETGAMAAAAPERQFLSDVTIDVSEEPLPVPPTTDVTATDGPAVAPPAAVTPTTPSPATTPSPTPTRRPPAGGPDRSNLPTDATAAANALFGDEPGGPLGRDLGDRQPGRDLGDQLDRARDNHVSIGDGTDVQTRHEDAARPGTGTGPDVDGPGSLDRAGDDKRGETAPHSSISVVDRQTRTPTSLTPDDVLDRIMSKYMTGLKRCHRTLLGRDPDARGAVTLRFTVGTDGTVTAPSVEGFDAGVDACIESRVDGWTFSPPLDGAGAPTKSTYAITLALQPD